MHAIKAVPAFLIAMTLFCAATRVQAEHEHWSYSGHLGPAEWAEADSSFATCKLGKIQSPIDIRGAKVADLPAIRFDYKPSPLKVIDNGHTIQVNYAPGSSIEVGGTRYELVQFHFHKPSEEKIGGKAHAMVAHLVHKSADGKLAVVAVLLDKGGASSLIDTVWKNLPKEKEHERDVDAMVDATALLPGNKGYYTFEGSLTTPPCSEDVRWFVLKTPVRIAGSEIAAFGKHYAMNARPTQPLNGRAIEATR
ncbi:carbonic anhydrase [Variovorax sp. dw_308]|uniref:carbonic anhydrase n=1 Tax=Variovorax sp. dw_308 TaxID=2721546 RepID=UPI00210BAA8A|nr:carbonic anhydrase family protein [Variovorax sp. dw_308]